MSSDFNFTVASWFLWNVRVKPHWKHSGGGPVCKETEIDGMYRAKEKLRWFRSDIVTEECTITMQSKLSNNFRLHSRSQQYKACKLFRALLYEGGKL